MELGHTLVTSTRPVSITSNYLTSQTLTLAIGNAGIISQNLTVTNNVPGVNGLSQGKTQDFNITVAMPSNLACTGGASSLFF